MMVGELIGSTCCSPVAQPLVKALADSRSIKQILFRKSISLELLLPSGSGPVLRGANTFKQTHVSEKILFGSSCHKRSIETLVIDPYRWTNHLPIFFGIN
jgi:hypothetical protein